MWKALAEAGVYAFSAFDIVIKSESDKNIDFLYGFLQVESGRVRRLA